MGKKDHKKTITTKKPQLFLKITYFRCVYRVVLRMNRSSRNGNAKSLKLCLFQKVTKYTYQMTTVSLFPPPPPKEIKEIKLKKALLRELDMYHKYCYQH